MPRRWMTLLFAGVLGVALWSLTAAPARAQNLNLNNFYYYPYYYFPHNYWPTQSPQWPEPYGAPYMKPPAYMAYPPFREPHWRYEMFEGQRHHRGFHFWLDQF